MGEIERIPGRRKRMRAGEIEKGYWGEGERRRGGKKETEDNPFN